MKIAATGREREAERLPVASRSGHRIPRRCCRRYACLTSHELVRSRTAVTAGISGRFARHRRAVTVEAFRSERTRGVEVDHEFKLGRLIDRQLGRLRALENPPSMNAGPAIGIREAVSVTHEAIGPSRLTTGIDGRNCMLL